MPSSIILVSGAPQRAYKDGGTKLPIVRVYQADGTPYASTQVRWTIPNGGKGRFPSGSNPQNTTTDVNGFATSPNLETGSNLGTWNYKAHLVSEPTVQLLMPFETTDDGAFQIGVIIPELSRDFQRKPAGSVYSDLIFQVWHQLGSPLTSLSMTISKLSGPADFLINGGTAPYTAITDSAGRIAVPMQAGATVGEVRIQCTRATLNPLNCTGIAFATVYAGTPAVVQVNAGNGQTVNVSTAFGAIMKAKVVDSGGAPVAGATVTFTNPASGASALFSNASNVCTDVTDASGIAESLTFTANAEAGTWNCSASCPPATPASFTQSNAGVGVKNEDSMQYCEA